MTRTNPATTIKEPILEGIDKLTQAQFAAVSKTVGLPEPTNVHAAAAAHHRGIVEAKLSHLKPDGDEVHDLLAKDPEAFTDLANAFGYHNPKTSNLSHVGRVERATALQKKLSGIAV